MITYVVSAPRSGMNWLRYFTEHFYGVRTPGNTSLIPAEDCTTVAFQRLHDALNRVTQHHQTGLWQGLDLTADTRISPFSSAGCANGKRHARGGIYAGT